MLSLASTQRRTSVPSGNEEQLARRFTREQLSGYARTEVDPRWLLAVSSGTGLIRPEKLNSGWLDRAGSSAIYWARQLRDGRMRVKPCLPRNEVARGIKLAFDSLEDVPIKTGNATVDGVAEIARRKLWDLPLNKGYCARKRKSLSFVELAGLVTRQLDYQGCSLGPQKK